MPGSPQLRLGTRGSALALWQARWVRGLLAASYPETEVEIVPIRTTGDRVVDRPLAAIGGKGLFSKELDEALLRSEIDLAVHSLKDLPWRLTAGAALAALLPRADPRDALVSNGPSLGEMPAGGRIGTSSLRRRAQLLHRFPHLSVGDLRGNVDTRLRKLDDGDFDGVILAAAGLDRLGHSDRITERLDPDLMLPAVGQGVVAAVCRGSDKETAARLEALDDRSTRLGVTAERALIEVLDGNCQIPVGAYATVEPAFLRLRAVVADPDGGRLVRDEIRGTPARARDLGRELGERLLRSGGRAILDRIHGA